MKTTLEVNKKKTPVVRIDPSLDKYDNIILFPEKLEEANKRIRKSGFPKVPVKKGNR